MVELANRLRKQELDPLGTHIAQLQSAPSGPEGKISFTGTAPDTEMPYEVKEALIAAVRDGNSAVLPESALKSKIAQALKTGENWALTPDDIVLTSGGAAALSLALQCLLNEGDEVLLLAPYADELPAMVRMAGGIVKTQACVEDDAFKPSIEDLARAMTSRVKVLVISNPSSVTGAVYTEDEMKEIADLALSKGCVVLSDERYCAFAYDAPFKGIAALSPKYSGSTLAVRDIGHSFALNGQKIAAIIAPTETARKLETARNAAAGKPDRLSIAAAMAAYDETPAFTEKMVREYLERRDYLVEALNGMHGVRCQKPAGGIFLFPNIQYYLAKEVGGIVPTNSAEFSNILFSKANLELAPGNVFGMEGHVRMSLALPMEELREGLKRMRQLLDR